MDPDLELDPGQATPLPDDVAVVTDRPLTRRELRARERAAEATVAGVAADEAAPAAAVPAAEPVALTAHDELATIAASEHAVAEAPATPEPEKIVLTEPLPKSAREIRPLRMPPLVTRAVEPPRVRRRRAWVGKGASFVAMLFVAGMAVATSLPANAFVTPAVTTASLPSVVTEHGQEPADQTLASGHGVTGQAVVRDVYKVKTIAQVAATEHIRTAGTFTNDPNGTIQWPFPVGVPIASYFGPRIAPTAGASSFHEGVDFDPGRGAPIQVIADGVVREVAPYNDNALGVHVIVDHMIDGQLVSSVYGHMTPGSIKVTQGQTVKVGDILGLVGSTGISTGPHLHFEIRLNGTTPVDPYAWLKQHAN